LDQNKFGFILKRNENLKFLFPSGRSHYISDPTSHPAGPRMQHLLPPPAGPHPQAGPPISRPPPSPAPPFFSSSSPAPRTPHAPPASAARGPLPVGHRLLVTTLDAPPPLSASLWMSPHTRTPPPSLSLPGLKSHRSRRHPIFLPHAFSSARAHNHVFSSPIDPLSDAGDRSTTGDEKFRAATTVFSPSQ
jgi:hypothetical protein